MATANYQYSIPFDEFDWQTHLISIISEFAVDSTIEVLKTHKSVNDIEWKDTDGIMDEVYRNNLMEKILEKMKKKYEEFGNNF